MAEHISTPAEQALLQAFQARGHRALLLNGTTVQLITPSGARHVEAAQWLREAAPLHPSQLPGFSDQFVTWALQALDSGSHSGGSGSHGGSHSGGASGPASPAGPDLASEKLSVFLYTEEAVGKYRGGNLMLRDVAPGLLQMVMTDEPDGGFSGLDRGRLPAAEQDVFAAAVSRSLAGEHSVGTHEFAYGVLTYVQTKRPDAAAHLHVLSRHVKPAEHPHGALVSFPSADYVLMYPLGQAHPLESMFDMKNATEQIGGKAARAITDQLFWWRPGSYEYLSEADALRSGQLPQLRPVGMTMDERNAATGSVDVQLTTPETGELFSLFGA
ncbi:MAG: hypothetical protein HOV87_16365 [Catenulispora sp.]|nr:hypothetical protein [Catenulispora sp.]